MEKLEALRMEMSTAGVDVVIVPTNDPHFCEMPPRHYARREFISGFTGSAGTAVITKDQALLWTDARYFLQAEVELSEQWSLMKSGLAGVPTVHSWIADTLPEETVIGIDPYLFSVREAQSLKEVLEAKKMKLVHTDSNLVDNIWTEGREELCKEPAKLHPLKYAGLSAEAKLKRTAAEISTKGADAMLITKLDDIAWLLNIRGSDVPCTPLFVSYLVIRKDASSTLYADECRITPEVGANLSAALVAISDYNIAMPDVRSSAETGSKFWLEPTTTSIVAAEAASANGTKPIIAETPIGLAKAKKTEEEMNGMRSAYLKDGINWAKFLRWLEETIAKGETPTEVDVSNHLEKIRSELEDYLGPSFETIAAAGANGAVIHYRPTPEATSELSADGTFLCDAGCQFVEGTTDITRTMHFGKPTEWQRECFTRVLKGHIALDESIFPAGTTGFVLDSHARRHLWKIGKDYRHGTGHGVGAALCVHEGPQGISFRVNHVPLEAGMVLSNEPGYYEDHAFGIRIESVIAVRESDKAEGFLEFEQLTFVPLQKKMIDVSLLTDSECRWVDEYHDLIQRRVSPYLDEVSKNWLANATSPLERTSVATTCDTKDWSYERKRIPVESA